MSTRSLSQPLYYCGFDDIPARDRKYLMPEELPRLFKADADTDAVVVCLHGFGGTPYEVNPIATACAAAGVDAVTVVYPHHGMGNPAIQRREFARLRQEELLETASDVVQRARQRYARVGIFGLSMGGILALLMAADQQVEVCAVAAAALQLPAVGEVLIPLLSWAPFYLPASNQYDFYLPGYDFHHSWALRALWQVSRATRQRLGDITCPVLAIHSQQDDTIPPRVMDCMQTQLKAPLETAWFNRSSHPMPLDVEGEAIATQVAQFLRRHLQPEAGSGRPSCDRTDNT